MSAAAFDPAKAGRVAATAALPAGMLVLVALMVIPVSPTILDISFIANIMISLAILMVALSASKPLDFRSEEHTSELQSLMRISYAVFCLKKNKVQTTTIDVTSCKQ